MKPMCIKDSWKPPIDSRLVKMVYDNLECTIIFGLRVISMLGRAVPNAAFVVTDSMLKNSNSFSYQ